VADSSLDFDRQHKGSLYARAGILDYWILNLIDRVLEVLREPAAEASAPFGWRYRTVQILAPQSVIAPLALPSMAIAVAELLP
jgi:Uma2 family endonuclease